NNIVENNDLDTYNFSYGADFSVYMPWGTRIVTDIAMNSRRGYAQKEMNTNELIWNAQVSHSFLKGNALTISLEVNDILAEQSNISRVVNAMMSSDSRNNSIYQYGILRIIYKLNIFGGKNSFGPGQGGRMGFGQGGFPPGGMMGGRSARGVGGAPAGGPGRMGGGGPR
ncbi:MAG: outer membrane beta-barrel protein, partial [Bacteroidaceae bacterium]|nr:outer membrane beta-barrel protein [Bacteroidaceae bacterium]